MPYEFQTYKPDLCVFYCWCSIFSLLQTFYWLWLWLGSLRARTSILNKKPLNMRKICYKWLKTKNDLEFSWSWKTKLFLGWCFCFYFSAFSSISTRTKVFLYLKYFLCVPNFSRTKANSDNLFLSWLEVYFVFHFFLFELLVLPLLPFAEICCVAKEQNDFSRSFDFWISLFQF